MSSTPSYSVSYTNIKNVIFNKDAHLWNLNDSNPDSFKLYPLARESEGKVIEVKAVATHTLGGVYYLVDPEVGQGYEISDCDDYTPPVVSEFINVPRVPWHAPTGALIAPIKEPIKVRFEIPRYSTRTDALRNVNRSGTIKPDSYFPFKIMEGAINITDTIGAPKGWWINTDDLLSPEELLKKNWRLTYKPFRNRFSEIDAHYYKALDNDKVVDLAGNHRDLFILKNQPILIRGWFIGPDGINYGRPDDCVSRNDFQWYGVRRSNLKRIPKPELKIEPEEPEMIISEPFIPFPKRNKLTSILPPRISRVFDIVRTK